MMARPTPEIDRTVDLCQCRGVATSINLMLGRDHVMRDATALGSAAGDL